MCPFDSTRKSKFLSDNKINKKPKNIKNTKKSVPKTVKIPRKRKIRFKKKTTKNNNNHKMGTPSNLKTPRILTRLKKRMQTEKVGKEKKKLIKQQSAQRESSDFSECLNFADFSSLTNEKVESTAKKLLTRVKNFLTPNFDSIDNKSVLMEKEEGRLLHFNDLKNEKSAKINDSNDVKSGKNKSENVLKNKNFGEKIGLKEEEEFLRTPKIKFVKNKEKKQVESISNLLYKIDENVVQKNLSNPLRNLKKKVYKIFFRKRNFCSIKKEK
ncbi:hypothetical protein MHBO_003327 [Bonamia ostreae]|uniref:Uncharacterized protein n=1 Tax=Bonamia ostreae TaxID=126728 RepID=A0ABV2AQN4_9EUKA